MPAYDDPDQLLMLHRRLLAGDRLASEGVASLLLPSLVQAVSQQFPQTDEQLIWTGVSDAVLDYCARPQQFDESRGVPLDRFLQKAAWRNVANILRGEKRRKAREEKAGQEYVESAVELDPVVGNFLQQEEHVRRQQQQAELMNTLRNPKDRRILELRLQGERRTEAFAEVLEITHLPLDTQRREVKRAKDRVDKILRRHTGGRS
jgi:RNA polymerase sigma-70 factor (ECF subfamily)